jgi:hypothetical protein
MEIDDKLLDIMSASFMSKMDGWVAMSEFGIIFFESKDSWPTDKVVHLCLVSNGQYFVLPSGKTGYFQSKTMSSSPGAGTELESRNIGYIDGNLEVTLRVSENSHRCFLETQEVPNA